jgi:hypothetical protein
VLLDVTRCSSRWNRGQGPIGRSLVIPPNEGDSGLAGGWIGWRGLRHLIHIADRTGVAWLSGGFPR